MRGFAIFVLCSFALILTPAAVRAHFGIVIPSGATALEQKDADITLETGFIHPFARQGMEMAKPKRFFVRHDGEDTDLTESLSATEFFGERAWTAAYKLKTPGVYIFASVPEPYYESSEDSWIIHYAKTVVAAFGAEDGWDEPLGLPMEIIPLSRPFANYAGNVFSGRVLRNGKPLPDALVEVEFLNRDDRRVAPNVYFETQTVKTDSNGVFVFGIPWAGWWGFSAIGEGAEKISRDGEDKPVELGGVIWVEFREPVIKK